MDFKSFSIIICCYNSANRISKTLSFLRNLDYPKDLCEIILVDNNSSDNTAEVAKSFWEEHESTFKMIIIKEHKAGVAFARRAGISASNNYYGIFCDDDNWLDKNYLKIANNVFFQNPSIGLIGGSSIAVTNNDLPPWFYNYAKNFAVGIQSENDGDITHRKFLWGAGLCFRANLIRKIYSNIEPQVTGRIGDKFTSSGEDGEICAWFIFAGYRLYYAKDLKFYHFIEDKRLTNSYFKKFIFEQEQTLLKSYFNFLTVKYFLLNSGNAFGPFFFILKYFKNLSYLILNPAKTMKIYKIEQIIKRISK